MSKSSTSLAPLFRADRALSLFGHTLPKPESSTEEICADTALLFSNLDYYEEENMADCISSPSQSLNDVKYQSDPSFFGQGRGSLESQLCRAATSKLLERDHGGIVSLQCYIRNSIDFGQLNGTYMHPCDIAKQRNKLASVHNNEAHLKVLYIKTGTGW